MAYDSRQSLWSTTFEEFVPPKLLPSGHYRGLILRYETVPPGDDAEPNREDDPIYYVQPTEAMDDVNEAELDGVDLAEFELRVRFYITKRAFVRFRDFILSFGFPPNMAPDQTAAEVVGRKVIMLVSQGSYKNRQGRTVQNNNVDDIVGVKEE